MSKVSNEAHRDDVIRRIYKDAKQLDWLYVSNHEKTVQYRRWLEDPEVGGVLEQWMALDEARVWIKDGVMKEFARALAGEGSFAHLLDDHPHAPDRVIGQALGSGWEINGEIKTKPMNTVVRNGDAVKTVYWGAPKDVKHLVWAALEQSYRQKDRALTVVVLDALARPVSAAEKALHAHIAARTGVEILYAKV